MGQALGIAQLSFWFAHAFDVCTKAQQTPGVELVACWDSDIERGRHHAASYGVDFEKDLDRLLRREDVHAVSLCAEPFRHPDLAERAAAAGKHVFVEKPMASDVAGARRIAAAAERHGIQVMPAYNLRHNPVSYRMKELVDVGAIGDVTRVRRLHGHYHEVEEAGLDTGRLLEKWGDPVAEHRDSLFFAGSHTALWFEWMFGLPQSVQCMRHTGLAGLPIEDNSTTLWRYDGFVGVMECSELLPAQPIVTEIYGTRGVLVQLRGNLPSTRVDGPARTPLRLFRSETEEWEVPDLPPQFLRHEPAYTSPGLFFDALLNDRPVPNTVSSGVNSIAMLVAAERAAAEGREVDIDEVL